MSRSIAIALVALAVQAAAAQGVRITEYSSNPTPEWIEITNTTAAPIDMTNWSYSDSDRQPFDVSFSGLLLIGTILPGESIIFTESAPATFRAQWNLPASVRVFGPNTNSNLSSGGDEINIYNAAGVLVDRLTYTAAFAAVGSSRNVLPANLGTNNASLTVLSTVGDQFGSFLSTTGRAGNPGQYIPTPSAVVLAGIACLAGARRRRAAR